MTFYEQAQLCDLSYRLEKETEYQFCRRLSKHPLLSNSIVSCISEDGLEGFIAVDKDKHAVIVFRGTESALDIMTDIKGWPVANLRSAGHVHSGVQDSLDQAWPAITGILKDLEARSYQCIGHSLGGMLAVLCASWLSKECPELHAVAVTTFGSPACGSTEFCKDMNGRLPFLTDHVVNCLDLVARLWTPYLMKYRSCGRVTYVDHKKRVVVNPTFIYKLFDWIGWCWDNKAISFGVHFHSRRQYVELMGELKL